MPRIARVGIADQVYHALSRANVRVSKEVWWPTPYLRVDLVSVQPDVIFGVIDNGILAVLAVFGGELTGVGGAVIGGAVGNAVTDGIAGIFEGYWAEKGPLPEGRC